MKIGADAKIAMIIGSLVLEQLCTRQTYKICDIMIIAMSTPPRRSVSLCKYALNDLVFGSINKAAVIMILQTIIATTLTATSTFASPMFVIHSAK